MFGFDDDDFGLDDLIEADIQFGLFEDDDRQVLLQERKQNPIYLKKSEEVYKKLEQGFDKVERALKNPSYSEKKLFKARCELADAFELKFNLIKEKLEQDYQFIMNCAQQHPGNFPELEDYIDAFSEDFYELEDCLSAFDDVLEYEYEEGFEDKTEVYSDKKSMLENELSDIEILKDELEALDY